MKQKLLVAALALWLVLMLGGAALAATDPIVCSMEVSPSALSEPGEVSVTITVSNAGDTDMKDPLTLYSPTSEIVKDFGEQGSVTLKAGEVKTWSGKWDVNQRTLDNGQIVFFVKYFIYKDSGEKEAQSQPIRGKLNATESKTDIEIKRTISPGTAREGQEVTIKYDIVNIGTVSLKNVTLAENKDISAKTLTVAKELKAGEAAEVKLPIKMGKKDLTSSATITYTTGTSTEKQVKTVEAQKITYGEAALTAKLTSSAKGVAINGTVKLTLELKNNGNVNYTDVRVSDATLGDVFTNQELAAGGTLTLEKEITLTATTDYQFQIVAIDNTGTEVTLDSDSLTISAVDPSKMVHLNVIAAADRTEVYTQPGIVRFTVTVENDSEVDATNVSVYHGGTRIYTFPSIPAGQSRKLTRDAALSMEGKYQFTAVTVDAMENSNSFTSNAIQIAFSIPTPAPATPTPPLVPTAEPTYPMVTVPSIAHPSVGTLAKSIRMVFYPMMIIGILLLAGAAVLLVIATQKRNERKRASEAALDHLERAKRRDYSVPGEAQDEEPTPPPAGLENAPEPAFDAKADSTDPTGGVELPHMQYVRNASQRSSKGQADLYGKKSLMEDESLRTNPLRERPEEDLYHTYGSDHEPYAAASAAKPVAKPKDWSAYAKRPAAQDTLGGYEDPDMAFRPAPQPAPEPVEYPEGDEVYEQDAYTDGSAGYDPYAAYAQEGDAVYAEGYGDTLDAGYVEDPLGYEDPAAYPDGSNAYDDPAGYPNAQADASGYADPYANAVDPYTADAYTAYDGQGDNPAPRARRGVTGRTQPRT